jgi:hypothetical protein
MELISEINQIKKIMGLNLINEAPVPSWLDDLFDASKSLISKYVTNKDGLERLINDGLDDVSFKVLKKRLSRDKTFGDNLITQLEAAKSKLKNTDPNRVLLDARIDEIEDLLPKSQTLKPIPTLTFKDLSLEAQSLFTKTGKKLTSDEVSFLNDASEKIYNGVQKLDKKKVLILTNQLENLGQNIENAIAKLNKSNDVISRQKAKVLQQAWDKYSKQLKIIVDGIGKIPLKKTLFSLSKVTIGVVAILTLTGLFFKLKNTPPGKTVSDWISTIPNPFSTETTTNNGDNSTEKPKGKYD